MTETIKVLGISGSLRTKSHNSALLREAVRLAPAGMAIEIASIREIPQYDGDLEERGFPEPVLAFREKFRRADALLIATPEYNFSIPGVLKNVIDWLSRPPEQTITNGKPVAIMGAGGRLGSARAQYHLRQTFVFLNMYPVNQPEVMISNAAQRFDAQGQLVDEGMRARIRQLLEALVTWTRRLGKAS